MQLDAKFLKSTMFVKGYTFTPIEERWPSGRAWDSGARGQGFDPDSGRCVVSLRKIHLPPKNVLVIPRKQWFHPDKTEKLLTGT